MLTGASRLALLALLVGALTALLLPSLLPDKELDRPEERLKLIPHVDLDRVSLITPGSIFDTAKQQYNFGRYSRGIPDLRMHELTTAQKVLQKKNWHFISVSDESNIYGVAIADMGYIHSAFVYACDVDMGLHDKSAVLLPAGLGAVSMQVSASSGGACSEFSSGLSDLYARMCYNATSNTWAVEASGKMEQGNVFSINVTLSEPQSHEFKHFAMVYPLGRNR
jgi:hypothetical protein